MTKSNTKRGTKKDGTGSVRQRKDGIWEGRYYYEGKRYSTYAPTKAQVQAKLNKILVQIEEKTYISADPETVVGYLNLWLKEYSKHGIEPATVTSYDGIIHNHIRPYFDTVRLQALDNKMVTEMLNEKRLSGRADGKEGGLSAKTIKNIKNMLHLAFGQAVLENRIHKNPTEGVKIAKGEEVEQRVLNQYENTQLQNYLLSKDSTIHNAMLLLLNSGIRRGELLGLRWMDVDFARRTLQIRYALKRLYHPNKYQMLNHIKLNPAPAAETKTGIYLAPPKSEKSKRLIPLGEKGMLALQRQKALLEEAIKEQSKKERKQFNPHDFVFFMEDTGDYIEPRCFEDRFSKICKEVGLSAVNIHATRHTFATQAVSNNPHDIATVSDILGHAQIETTLKYTHAFDDKKIRVMNGF